MTRIGQSRVIYSGAVEPRAWSVLAIYIYIQIAKFNYRSEIIILIHRRRRRRPHHHHLLPLRLLLP